MAQGMPHHPRDKVIIAFEDEDVERIRLGIGGHTENRTAVPSTWTTRGKVAVAIALAVVLAVVVILALTLL